MSPAFCNPTTYDIYRQWCIDTHRTPPTRDWWDHSCSQPRGQSDRRPSDDEFDDEVEQREGWAR